jgi:hypothetical protein
MNSMRCVACMIGRLLTPTCRKIGITALAEQIPCRTLNACAQALKVGVRAGREILYCLSFRPDQRADVQCRGLNRATSAGARTGENPLKSVTGSSQPPTINSVAARTVERYAFAKSGRPPRSRWRQPSPLWRAAAIKAAAAPVHAPKSPSCSPSAVGYRECVRT